jgi:hypothetical protein
VTVYPSREVRDDAVVHIGDVPYDVENRASGAA